jgi:hypothetical protein
MTLSLSPVVKYHGLARRYCWPPAFLMRPLLNGGTLGGRANNSRRPKPNVPNVDGAAAFLERLDRACQTWGEVNPQEFAQLVRELERLPSPLRFDALAQAFADDHYLKQEYVGRILVQLNPTCPRPLSELLPQLLPGWNLSIEQLPRYLAGVFGHAALLDALDTVDRNGAQGQAKTKTIRYWLRSFEIQQNR